MDVLAMQCTGVTSPCAEAGPSVRSSYDYDESDAEDELRREEGISFPADSGPLGSAGGRSISLDPGALAGTQQHTTHCTDTGRADDVGSQ